MAVTVPVSAAFSWLFRIYYGFNAGLNPICHLLALLAAHHILHVSRVRVKGHFNPLNAGLNPICHLLALLKAHHILHVSRVRVKGHFNPSNAELNPICHLLALLAAHHILHVSRVRVKGHFNPLNAELNPICQLLALLAAHHILHVSRVRVRCLFLRYIFLSYFSSTYCVKITKIFSLLNIATWAILSGVRSFNIN